MRKRFYPILALACVLSFAACEREGIDFDSSEGKLFDDSIIQTVRVAVSEDEWNRLLDAYDKDSNTPEYVRCDEVSLVRGEQVFMTRDAGLRLRGNTSRRRPEGYYGEKHRSTSTDWHHVHFGLHFRKFSESGNIDGFKRFNLKYAKEDATYVREHFSYDLLARYGIWTAPMSSWCRVLLKVGDDAPANYGVYLMIESIDRQYISRRAEQFGGNNGWLWKCCWGANLRDLDNWRFDYDKNTSESHPYELKDNNPEHFKTAQVQLKGFIRNIKNLNGQEFHDWILKVCDVDFLLKMYAANIALGHWDDYWNDMNNFYLYFNSRDPENYKVFMLPYDYDNTLGTSHNVGVQTDSGRQDPYHWGRDECIFISKLLTFSDFRQIYTSYLRDFASIDNPWTGQAAAGERIRGWHKLISPYLDNDTGEDTMLKDTPPDWSNHHEYRLLEDCPNNWFKVKAESISYWIK